MDSIPHKEFMDMFHRVAAYMDMKGVRSKADMDKKMQQVIDMMQRARERAKKDRTKQKWGGRAKMLKILMKSGTKPIQNGQPHAKPYGTNPLRVSFQERVINEAIKYPKSIVAMTLQYGYERAMKMKKERERRRIGELRPVVLHRPRSYSSVDSYLESRHPEVHKEYRQSRRK